MAFFDVEYISNSTRQVRLGDVLADLQARRRLRRQMKRRGVDVPEQALVALSADPQDPFVAPVDPKDAYRVTSDGFVYRAVRNGALQERLVSNFTAVIETEVILDDGQDRHRESFSCGR